MVGESDIISFSLLFRTSGEEDSRLEEAIATFRPSQGRKIVGQRQRRWRLDCAGQGMNCPICSVALKVANHRSVEVNYCPVCGGTWLDRWGFDHLSPSARPVRRFPRWLLRAAILTALLLAGCLTVAVGAMKLWPTIRSWTEALLGAKETAGTSQVRQLAGHVAAPRILELSQSGLDRTVISTPVARCLRGIQTRHWSLTCRPS